MTTLIYILGFSLLNQKKMDSGQVSIKHTRSGQVSLKHVLSFRFDYFLARKERREISQFLLLST